MKSESAWTGSLLLIFSWHTLRFLLEHFSILLQHSSTLILSFNFSLKLYCQVNERLLGRSCVASLKKGRRKSWGWCVFVCVCVCVCARVCVERGGGAGCITSNDSLTYFSARTYIRKNRSTTKRRQQCALI